MRHANFLLKPPHPGILVVEYQEILVVEHQDILVVEHEEILVAGHQQILMVEQQEGDNYFAFYPQNRSFHRQFWASGLFFIDTIRYDTIRYDTIR